MKVYIVCTWCVIQHASPFILSLNVKSKMTTYILLPVILSELVDSDDEKPRRGKTQEWISFLNLSFFLFSLYTFFGLLVYFLFLRSSTSSAASSCSSSFCSCNLDRWSELGVWFFYCYWALSNSVSTPPPPPPHQQKNLFFFSNTSKKLLRNFDMNLNNLNIFSSALFHMKTWVCFKHFVHDWGKNSTFPK